MSDAPSIAQELERKVSETLSEALRAASRGDVSPDITKATLKALWDAGAGLISKDLMSLIADSIDALDPLLPAPRRRVFIKGDRTTIIALPDEFNVEGQILMTCKGGVKTLAIMRDDDTVRETAERTQRIIKELINNGYGEIQ